MGGELIIRRAIPADATRIMVLAGQLGYTVTVEQVAAHVEALAAEQIIIVADHPQQPAAGWVEVTKREILIAAPHAYLEGLVVEEAYRGQGIGKALLAAVEDWAREHACAEVWLHSRMIRKEAHQFYQAVGYRRVKEQYKFVKNL